MIETFDSEAGYRAAIDAIFQAAAHEVRIFDGDLSRLMLNDATRHSLIAAFLTAAPVRRLHIVLHDIELLRIHHPRMIGLIRSHGNQVEIRQTPDHLRQLSDRFVLADHRHGTLRFHADHPRGKHITDDNIEIHPIWQRFDELWESSQACSLAGATGL